MRARVELFSFVALALLACSCAGPTFAPDAAPEFLVTRDQSPLYRYGPQQAEAPEAWLKKDDRIRMLRHEFGYSVVQLPNGSTGYMANDDLSPAPPLPTPPERRSFSRVMVPSLPVEEEPPLPQPDLDATPVDAPAPAR